MAQKPLQRRFHFISGLPRSGSTLLSAILSQNPQFHASMSGPLAGMFDAMLSDLSDRNEYSVFISNDQRRRILRGLFDGYYGPEFNADVIFDTNRLWCVRLELLRQLFPRSKIIACVRHVSWVIDSIERLVRRNIFQPSGIFNYKPEGTVYSRAEGLAKGDGMVGFAHNAVKQAFYSQDPSNLMLLRFETLTSEPERAIAAVYAFIGEPAYNHDFKNVQYEADEFDRRIGTPGLHTVRPQVEPIARASVLPPDLFRRYEHEAFWLDPALNLHNVEVV
ncbi:sulfotransferase [Bradyrhizobium sp. CER78]|uniref:sulfotransferase family protein n=1 Tax=Bradyrhizobium sp. CER78 TaxID=3039162 RepID=UPI00244A2312|nr:sulfotransferase [Bradyrhizobium sp. CER78]MDH2385123.1 sulfotransferase [Bradyrhizobium sp. CER78]